MKQFIIPFTLASTLFFAACSETTERASDQTASTATSSRLGASKKSTVREAPATTPAPEKELIAAEVVEAPVVVEAPKPKPAPVVVEAPKPKPVLVVKAPEPVVAAAGLKPNQVKRFNAADTDGNGTFSLSEYEAFLKSKGIKANIDLVAAKWFNNRDKDGDGALSVEEVWAQKKK